MSLLSRPSRGGVVSLAVGVACATLGSLVLAGRLLGAPVDRLAPASAAGFLLVGLALLAAAAHPLLAQGLALAVLYGGLVVLVGHGYRIPALYGAGSPAAVGTPAALLLALLAAGALARTRGRGLAALLAGDTVGALMLRRLLPVAVLVPIGLGWLKLQAVRAGLYGSELGLTLMVLVSALVLAALLTWNAASLHRLDVERRQAERTLRENEERSRSIVDAAYDAFVAMDAGGRIEAWNPQAEATFGWPRSEALGRSLADTIIPPRFREEHRRGLERFLATGHGPMLGRRLELVGLHRDGHELPVELSISPVWLGDRYVFNALLHDISERKRTEAEVAALNAELQTRVAALTAANEELDAFSYTISHDLRAPLRAMQGFAQALLEDHAPRLGAEGRDYARRIVGAAARMDTLIHDLLKYSRLARVDLQPRPVDLQAVVAEALAHLGAERASVRIEEPLPPVAAHHSTLVQVMANLIGNGLKFVPAGREPAVRVAAVERGGRVRVEVEDNGIGIAPEHQERIFRLFERLHAMDSYPGTGVGLAIVRKAVTRMGGRAGVCSWPGTGSLFWVELPAAQALVPVCEEARPA